MGRPYWKTWKIRDNRAIFRINEQYHFSEHVISEIPTATPIFRPCSIRLYIIDIDRHPPTARKQMPRIKPEVHCISGLAWENNEISWLPNIFADSRRRYSTVDTNRDVACEFPARSPSYDPWNILIFKGSKTPFFIASVAILIGAGEHLRFETVPISMILRQSSRHRRPDGLL